MNRTRNPFLARCHQLRAFLLHQRPGDLERRLHASAADAFARSPVTPATAWDVYTSFSSVRCSADEGWLAQYGVHDFTGREEFHFSLVRQVAALEHWNDEFFQIELLLLHPPTPELRALKGWSSWSLDFPSLEEFHDACSAHEGLRHLLASRSTAWRWSTDVEPT
jgi:hypothetical protein